MTKNYENIIKHYDLYKAYGEFNFLFEDTVQEYRLLTIALVRISYEYFEEEDEEQNELPYTSQDRLLKILINNMGANETIEKCRACFIDFFQTQKRSLGSYAYKYLDEVKKISDSTYHFALEIFKKSLQLVELRNTIIHSHYSESISIPEIRREDLKGRKEFKTGKGYELRNYTLDTNLLEKLNHDITLLQFHLTRLRTMHFLEDPQKATYAAELDQLKNMNFEIKFSVHE